MSIQVSSIAGQAVRPTGSAAKGWLRALELTARLGERPLRTLPVIIDEMAAASGDAPALIGERESFSYRELADRMHRYGRFALAQGLGVGDTVCLMMQNRPEYLAIWLGVTAVGGVVALLNTNLAGAALAHCVRIASPKHVIVAAELMPAFRGAGQHLDPDIKVWVHGEAGAEGFARLDVEIERLEIERHGGETLSEDERRGVSLSHRALCIYTSGTTGLPKAANVSHHRLLSWSYWFAGMTDARASDRMYDCLPLYHSIGGVVATGSLLVAGGSVVIKERFSARRFWDDIVQFDCTLFQYIGELCRYLVKAPQTEASARHRLRLCSGNGLRADVWTTFQERFRIPQVLEFYAATEGNFSLYNLEGKVGAIGRIPSFLAHGFPAAIVKFDIEAGAPLRDAQGFCLRCARGEAGEAIGRISQDGGKAAHRFEGYTSAAESERKILRDVFVKGDAWLRTGDLMCQDEAGFFYFVDRIGDTFRWKGENVATFEVAEAVLSCPGVIEANVYGVAVPGTEGRAGMAALVVEEGFVPSVLRAHLAARLPDYARPLFLRICDALEITETFKQKKHNLVQEGFDPAIVEDRLFIDHPEEHAYTPLNAALHARIMAGEMRL